MRRKLRLLFICFITVYIFFCLSNRLPSTRNMKNWKRYPDQRVLADQEAELVSTMTVPMKVMTKPAIQNLLDQVQHKVFHMKNLQSYLAESTEWNIQLAV